MNFGLGTALTLASRLGALFLGLGTSIVLARILGPEGKGIHSLAILLPSLVVAFTNLGIAPATIHLVARRQHALPQIAGSTLVYAIAVSVASIILGLIVILALEEELFSGVARLYLLLGLAVIPVTIVHSYFNSILLGLQQLRKYNLVTIIHECLTLALVVAALWALRFGVSGAILALVVSGLLTDLILLVWVIRATDGIQVSSSREYLKAASTYGIKAHIGSVLAFLNYRIDMFMVNWFLNPTAVGFYAIAVALVERLWLVSQSAATVLFPRVSGESNELRLKEFTPLVARAVFLATLLGAIVVYGIGESIVRLFYSDAYLPAVAALQVLLPGIVALGVARILANDLAGRGRPGLNAYVAFATVLVNVGLNLIWIPRHGITGAALASSTSYTVSFLATVCVYSRISGNRWTSVVLPQRGDWTLYWRSVSALIRQVRR